MKRFVLLAATVMFCCHIAIAQDVQSVFYSYSSVADVSLLSVDRKTFNFVKSLIPIERETKKLLKALDLEQLDILDLSGASSTVRGKMIAELEAIGSGDNYVLFSEPDNDISMMARSDGDILTEFTIFSLNPSDRNGTFIRIDCKASLATIIEMAGSNH